jgi:sugar O-acyltransferase (sialic acid O-acetyltransferase NeuD family)
MKIIIIGAGGHGRVVLDILRNSHQVEVAGFIDADNALHHKFIDGIEVLGDFSLLQQFGKLCVGGAIVAIGDNRIRNSYAQAMEKIGISLVNAIHPAATIAGNAHIGKNVVIAAGVTICTHAVIADSVICNTGCIIDHESTIRQAAHICPGVKIAGHVKIGELAFVGIGSTVVQSVEVGESAVVGAGAVVLRDVPAYSTVVGVPAHIAKTSHLPNVSVSDDLQTSTADLEPARSIVTRPKRRRPVPVASLLKPQQVQLQQQIQEQ